MSIPVRRPAWYWAAATVLIGSLAALSYFSVQSGQLLQSSLNPASLLRLPAFETKTTRSAVKMPVTTTRVVKETVAPQPSSTVEPPMVPLVKTPAIAEVKTAPAAPVEKKAVLAKPEVKVAKVVAKPVQLDPIMVVAGSFSSRSNALRLKRQLQKAGFENAFLILPTRRRELIKVAAYGATTLAEADTAMLKVSEITGVPAWLMRTR